jgi:hypothetical protein
MISYSAITNYGKATLPSVESWGTNNNILKDPPRSYTTRRIDKVGATSEIDQMIQESGDRVAEVIKVYPRGVNPMVSVSYDNFGRNGGEGKGQALVSGGRQAKLPYQVNKQGAFRPPILAPVDLLPLSRFPRNVTSVDATIHNPDYTKQIRCPEGSVKDARAINESILHVPVQSTVTYNTNQPYQQSGSVNDARAIKESILHVPVQSTVTYNTNQPYQQSGGVGHSILTAPLQPGAGSNLRYHDRGQHSTVHTDKYTHDVLNGEARTNKSHLLSVNLPHTMQEKVYHRKTPLATAYTNTVGVGESNGYSRTTHYELPPRPKIGGFDGAGTLPVLDRIDGHVSLKKNQARELRLKARMEQGY